MWNLLTALNERRVRMRYVDRDVSNSRLHRQASARRETWRENSVHGAVARNDLLGTMIEYDVFGRGLGG